MAWLKMLLFDKYFFTKYFFTFIRCMIVIITITYTAFCYDLPAAIAEENNTPFIIREIKIEKNRRVETEAIRRMILSQEKKPFSSETIAQDIERIFQMGYFENIEVYQETDKNEVRLIYIITEKPSVNEVKYEGHDELSEDDIKEVVDIKPYSILDETKLVKNAEKIRELYSQKGFYLAEVNYRLIQENDNQVNVIFSIAENKKVAIRTIQFIGNHALESELIKSFLQTKEGDALSFMSSGGNFQPEIFDIDVMRISHLYFDHGYIHVKVGKPVIQMSPDLKYLDIFITIFEGEQYFVGNFDFSGDLLEKKNVYAKKLTLQTKDVFNRSMLSQDMLSLKRIYEDQGYAYANVSPLTNIDEKSRIIHVNYQFEKGEKVYFERINIKGNSKTRDKVIRRELKIIEGDLFNETKKELSKNRVLALGYFENVEFKTRQGSRPDTMIVDIEVTERPTGTFQVGFGLSSIESFIFNSQISQHNLFGRGQTIIASAQVSSLRKIYNLRFVEPYFLDSHWTLASDLYNTERFLLNYSRLSSGGDITWGYPLPFYDDLQFYGTYTLEFIDIEQRINTPFPILPDFTNYDKYRTSSLRLSSVWDTRDNRLFPSKGNYISLSSEFAPNILGSDRPFNRYSFVVRHYLPIIWDLVFKSNLDIGLLNSPSGRDVPIPEKFLMGGINSVRGYRLFSIGPERPVIFSQSNGTFNPQIGKQAFLEGGEKQFILNLELEFPIIPKAQLKGVVFYDAGNSYGEDENFFYVNDKIRPLVDVNDPFDPKNDLYLGLFHSVGFGFRWFSPLGPLRFEWGFPLTPRPSDKNYLFEFTIGNIF